MLQKFNCATAVLVDFRVIENLQDYVAVLIKHSFNFIVIAKSANSVIVET